MKKLSALVAAFALVAALPAAAAAQDPPKPTQEQKPADAKPTYAGKWSLSFQSPSGTMMATLDVALDEKEPNKVSGQIASEMGTYAIYGEIEEGTLWFAVSPDGANEIWFKGNLQADGTMTGAIDMQGNLVPWTATRAKDK